MQCPHYILTTFSTVLIELPTAAKAVNAAFKPLGMAKIQRSKSMLKSSPEGIWMRAIGRTMGVHHNRKLLLVSRSRPKATESNRQAQACSFIEVDELCTFIAKEAQTLDLGRDQF